MGQRVRSARLAHGLLVILRFFQSPHTPLPTCAQETFARMVEEAGFRAVTYENLTAGVVAIHSGFKL
jgi:hypothetical protein